MLHYNYLRGIAECLCCQLCLPVRQVSSTFKILYNLLLLSSKIQSWHCLAPMYLVLSASSKYLKITLKAIEVFVGIILYLLFFYSLTLLPIYYFLSCTLSVAYAWRYLPVVACCVVVYLCLLCVYVCWVLAWGKPVSPLGINKVHPILSHGLHYGVLPKNELKMRHHITLPNTVLLPVLCCALQQMLRLKKCVNIHVRLPACFCSEYKCKCLLNKLRLQE